MIGCDIVEYLYCTKIFSQYREEYIERFLPQIRTAIANEKVFCEDITGFKKSWALIYENC